MPPPYTINIEWQEKKGDIISEKKMGRPTTNPKIYQTRIRMTEEEVQKLNFCSEKLGISKTDVISIAVDKIYKGLL